MNESSIKAIGPFSFDIENKKITFAPGTYIIKQPLTFGVIESMEIADLEYDGRSQDDR
jgi:hypothetical protein